MYFNKFPTLVHESVDGVFYIVKDITFNVRIRKDTLKQIALYEVYHVVDGDTPEKIAEKVYGDPNLHWVVLLANEMYNWVEEFPLTTQEFEEYLDEKYADNPSNIRGSIYARNTIHHYENLDGDIVHYNPTLDALLNDQVHPSYSWINEDLTNPTPITIYDIEERSNESRRRIKIISPNILHKVITAFSMVN
jgi:hypothetical protein